MNIDWVGKIVGSLLGYLVAGVWGALAGLVFGHGTDLAIGKYRENNIPDREQGRGQSTYIETLFTIMGYVAKADGRVSKQEIRVADALIFEMGMNREQRDHAIELFRQGKRGEFSFNRQLSRLNSVIFEHTASRERFLRYQIYIALADNSVSQEQMKILFRLGRKLDVHKVRLSQLADQAPEEVAELLHRHTGGFGSAGATERNAPLDQRLARAYALLKVSCEAEDGEVVRAYRRQLSRQHPDKLSAQGATDKQIKEATVRTRSIRSAYEQIRESRGIS